MKAPLPSTVPLRLAVGGVPAINVGTIIFNSQTTSGYIIGGGPITLAVGITNNSTTVGGTISSVITGSAGLAFTGVAASGVTTSLTGANTYTGITTVSTGSRLASNATGLGSNFGASLNALGSNYTQVNG